MEKITLQISDKVSIEIDNPTDVMENYSQEFYTYYEHEYEINFEEGELTDNKLREVVLEKRFKGSKNTDLQKVLIKVALLDNFYRTRIPVNNIVPIARHIQAMNIDERLYNEEIDVDLVNDIAYGTSKYKKKIFDKEKEDAEDLNIKISNVYSFASKYCSWHNPEYPIADSYSKGMLFYINKAEPFCEIPSKVSLNDYRVFYEMYMAFKKHYFGNTPDISNKKIDTYLWKYAQIKIIDLKKNNLKCIVDLKKGNERLSDYIKIESEMPSDLKKKYNQK